MNNIEIHGIFPTPVITTWYELDSNLLNILRKEADNSIHGAAKSHGIRSNDTNILNREEFAEMREYMCGLATVFLRDILAYDITGARNVQSWVSVKRPGEAHQQHFHPNCMATAVYFFDENHTDAEPLYLHKEKHLSNTMELTQSINPEKQSESSFAWAYFTIPAEKGRLVFFPSNIQHSVPVNNTDQNRYSFAMNFIPDPFDWDVNIKR